MIVVCLQKHRLIRLPVMRRCDNDIISCFLLGYRRGGMPFSDNSQVGS